MAEEGKGGEGRRVRRRVFFILTFINRRDGMPLLPRRCGCMLGGESARVGREQERRRARRSTSLPTPATTATPWMSSRAQRRRRGERRGEVSVREGDSDDEEAHEPHEGSTDSDVIFTHTTVFRAGGGADGDHLYMRMATRRRPKRSCGGHQVGVHALPPPRLPALTSTSNHTHHPPSRSSLRRTSSSIRPIALDNFD